MMKTHRWTLAALAIVLITALGVLFAQDETAEVAAEDTKVEGATTDTFDKDVADIEKEMSEAADASAPAKGGAAALDVAVDEMLGEEKGGTSAVEAAAPGVAEEAAPAVEAPAEEAAAETPAEAPAETPAGEPVVAEAPAAVEGAGGDTAEKAFADAQAEGVSDAPVMKGGVEAAIASDEEILRRKAAEGHAKETLVLAEEALAKKDYLRAINLFEEVAKHIGTRPETKLERDRARQGLGEAHYGRALMFLEQRDFVQAIASANSSANAGNPRAAKLAAKIKAISEKPPKIAKARHVQRWDSDEYQKYRGALETDLLLGREYFDSGEYSKSGELFRKVLYQDPNNTEAMRMMRKLAERRYDVASYELEATHRDAMTSLRQTWNPRDYELSANLDLKQVEAGKDQQIREIESTRVKILNKMDQIEIPEVDFRQANINDVVEFLHSASVEYDPTPGEGGKKGVNIILNLGAAQATAAEGSGTGTEEDPFAAEVPAVDTAPADASKVPLITFRATYISLMEALKIVTDIAQLKYRIDGSVVMLLPKNAAEGEIITRMYDVLPTLGERITAVGGPEDAEPGFGEGGSREIGANINLPDRVPWKEFFGEMGVKWPEGSSLKYVAAIGKIIVANTSENLTVFESILAVLNVVPNQIEIEARFVEIGQRDMDALGFEWNLTDNWELAYNKKSATGLLIGTERVQVAENASGGGFTKGLRTSEDFAPVGTALGTASDVLRIASVLTNPELEFVLHMLEQQGNADVLSAPKVTTESGSEATIKVVTEYIYPTEFNVEPIMGVVEGMTVPVGGLVEPGSFEMREVGVILVVQPEVSPEGHMIKLAMSPEVVDEPEWVDYGSEITLPNGTINTLPMRQPFFHSRSVNTSISVYNGATVAMGGMITEERMTANDKIPFLGDLPLLGRLFRSNYDDSVKKNLMIFVTARLVDPSGRGVGRAAPTTPEARLVQPAAAGGAVSAAPVAP